MSLTYTPIDEISKIREHARTAFLSGKAKSIAFRKTQIAQVGYMIKDNEERLKAALQRDLGRPPLETEFFDCTTVYIDVRKAYDNVSKWADTHKAEFDLGFWAMNPRYRAEPKGVVVIIAPFNGPLVLLFSPLVGAIAGGNAVVLKPSELTPNTAALIAELVPKYLDKDLYHVVNGGIPETTKLLEYQWDHILYTGNGRVARIISAAAAKHLTPMTLELGGKNPVIVDPKCDLKAAARRILWGRYLNAGQICVCPEYVLIPASVKDSFISAIKESYDSFYPDGPKESKSFGRLISQKKAEHVKGLLDQTKGKIILGGEVDVGQRYISPTVVDDVSGDDSLMNEELFAPILIIIPTNGVDDAIKFVNERDHPLVIYVFSTDKAFQNKVTENTQSGAVVANDTMMHVGVPGIPMGGIGPSGHGYYTGKDMFDEFTHKRSLIDNPSWMDKLGLACRFPPYKTLKPLQMFMPSLPPRPQTEATATTSRYALWLSTAAALIGLVSVMLAHNHSLPS